MSQTNDEHKLRPARAPVPPAAEEPSWGNRILAILRSNPFINGVVAAAITVGFFHGWLKLKIDRPFMTFAFDGLLCLALALIFLQQKRGTPFFPPGRIGAALKTFYLVCALYLLLPWRPPVLLSIAAIRGWCFATLMFALGYYLTKEIRQVRGYFYVILLLGLITAGYGLQQSPDEIEEQMMEDERFAERYKFTFYSTESGRQLRIFSTFVSAGAFGGTMAYVIVFALALVTEPRLAKRERLLLLAAVVPMGYALILSGSRSALISLLVGFVIIAWYRRSVVSFVFVPALILIILKFAADSTGGATAERFATLFNWEDVWARNRIPTALGWQYLTEENLLGGGLGRSGYSVPLFLIQRTAYYDYVGADGDLGRLMIEMGVVGLIFFGRVLVVSLLAVFRWLKELRDTPVAPLALASAACILIAIVSFPSGSPFLSIPMGALVWFFVGTLQKLSEQYAAAPAAEAPVRQELSEKRFLYYRPEREKQRRPRRHARA